MSAPPSTVADEDFESLADANFEASVQAGIAAAMQNPGTAGPSRTHLPPRPSMPTRRQNTAVTVSENPNRTQVLDHALEGLDWDEARASPEPEQQQDGGDEPQNDEDEELGSPDPEILAQIEQQLGQEAAQQQTAAQQPRGYLARNMQRMADQRSQQPAPPSPRARQEAAATATAQTYAEAAAGGSGQNGDDRMRSEQLLNRVRHHNTLGPLRDLREAREALEEPVDLRGTRGTVGTGRNMVSRIAEIVARAFLWNRPAAPPAHAQHGMQAQPRPATPPHPQNPQNNQSTPAHNSQHAACAVAPQMQTAAPAMTAATAIPDAVHAPQSIMHVKINTEQMPDLAGKIATMTGTTNTTIAHAELSDLMKANKKISGKEPPAQIKSKMLQLITYVLVFKVLPYTFFMALFTVLEADALEWYTTQLALDVTWTSVAAFEHAFGEHFYGSVRNLAIDARQRLMDGKVQQGRQNVAQYVQRLRTCIQQAGDMSVSDQIAWFLRGLRTELRVACTTDSTGRPWTNMQALTDYAFGQELRLQAAEAARTAAPAMHRPSRPFTSQRPAGRGKDEDVGNRKRRPERRVSNASGGAGPSNPKKTNKGPYSGKWGPPNDPNKLFPHLTNKEVHDRRNEGRCCKCGAKGHIADKCQSTQSPK